jgi:hypothetical protein
MEPMTKAPTIDLGEATFQEACRWLSKSAPADADRVRWLIERGMLTADGQLLTRRARRALDKSKSWANHVVSTLDVTADKLKEAFVREAVDMFLAKEVAAGRSIRLADGSSYVNADRFDPQKHERTTDKNFLELNRADIEQLIAQDHERRHQLSRLLSVADLTGWDGQGSPAVWLWEREYLKSVEGGYTWTAKATRNKKLSDKLRRMPTLFSLGERHA